MATYAPKHGTPYTQRDAERICPEILRLMQLHGGGLTKAELLEAAKSRRSPLHRDFVWDDAAAAEKYRLDQASRMLRAFEVVYTQDRREHRVNLTEYVVQTLQPVAAGNDDLPTVRPQRNASRQAGRRCYVPVTAVMTNEDYQQQLVARAREDLQSYRNRYEKIRHLVDFRTRFGRAFNEICRLLPYEET